MEVSVMLSDLLWFMGAKQQHDMQKAQGLSGLIFILLTIGAVWKWNDWIVPVLNWFGIVDMLKRTGYVTDDVHITFFNITALFLLLLFLFIASLATFLIVGFSFLYFFQSKIGEIFIWMAGMVLFILLGPFIHRSYKKKQRMLAEEKEAEKEDDFLVNYNKKLEKEFDDFIYSYPVLSTDGKDRANAVVDKISTPAPGQSMFPPVNTVQSAYALREMNNQMETTLDKWRASLFFHDIEKGKFHYILPNPLPEAIEDMQEVSLEEEEHMLKALERISTNHVFSSTANFATIELEYVINREELIQKVYFLPVKDAQIEYRTMATEQLDANKYKVLHFPEYFSTMDHIVSSLNERADVEQYMERVNLNTHLLHTVVNQAKEAPNSLEYASIKWPQMEQSQPFFQNKIAQAIQKFNEIGYTWRVKNG